MSGWILLGYVVVSGLPLTVVVMVIFWPVSSTSKRWSVDEIEQRVTRLLLG
ncbi:hypothetical protein OIE68_34890 [Nocardia vinacea]|uniref:Uncharacterized protein n=1 Tax=Nocardia vinacea TaxID=96468 RepID=A0ABZ1Z5H8_9NOCA|nr:hypothetical protein OIE68_34890 [Nocardia vinacea]